MRENCCSVPEVLRKIEGLLVERLKCQAAGNDVLSELEVPVPEGAPRALIFDEGCIGDKHDGLPPTISSQNMLSPPRSSSRPAQKPSFSSARRMMKDFSRTMSIGPDQEELECDDGMQRFRAHSKWKSLRQNPTEQRRTTTRQWACGSLEDGHQSAVERCPVRWSRARSMLSMIFIILDVAVLPLGVFGIGHMLLDGLAIAFWTLRLLHATASLAAAWRRPELRRLLLLAVEALLVAARVVQAFVEDAWGPLFATQLVRVVALPRFYEASGLAAIVHDALRKRSREVRVASNIVGLGIGAVVLLHCLTCTWFSVGSQSGGWTEEAGLADMSWDAQYVRSMEWALSRLPPSRIPANMQLHTRTERTLAVLGTVLCVLFASIFTSVVTNDISDLRRMSRMQKDAEDKLCDFLEAHPVPRTLEQQLRSYARRHMTKVQAPGKEELASSLPHFMYEELCAAAFRPIVCGHTLLGGLCNKYTAVQRDLCVRCLVEWNVMAQEMLFLPGQKCESLLFVARGSIIYSLGSLPPLTGSAIVSSTRLTAASVVPTTAAPPLSVTRLSHGDWLCEHCLWTTWSYLGQARADAGADMLYLSCNKLFELAKVCTDAAIEIATYAELAVNLLNSTPEENLSDLPIEL